MKCSLTHTSVTKTVDLGITYRLHNHWIYTLPRIDYTIARRIKWGAGCFPGSCWGLTQRNAEKKHRPRIQVGVPQRQMPGGQEMKNKRD